MHEPDWCPNIEPSIAMWMRVPTNGALGFDRQFLISDDEDAHRGFVGTGRGGRELRLAASRWGCFDLTAFDGDVIREGWAQARRGGSGDFQGFSLIFGDGRGWRVGGDLLHFDYHRKTVLTVVSCVGYYSARFSS